MSDDLPRVTYSNVGADLSAVHDRLDRAIPAFKQTLGRFWPNLINGRPDREGTVLRVASPIDDRMALAEYAAAAGPVVERAVEAARAAFPDWSGTPWSARVAIMRRAADLLAARKWDLGIACLLEVGKSRMEAMGEAEEAIDLIRTYCDQMEREEGYLRPMQRAFPREATSVLLRPYGVFAVIAPFNFPLALSVNMMAGALIAGNTVVYKPSPKACLTGALLVEALTAAGLPAGVVNLVMGEAAGPLLAEAAGVDGIAFTGSHRVGMEILRRAAAGRFARPVIAEMGGKNPAYVTASADLDVAAEGVMRSAFGLQGQKCSACSVAYVDAQVMEAFVERLVARTTALRIGDPADRAVFIGPLINEEAANRHAKAVAQAESEGRVLRGGRRLQGDLFAHGAYVEPTIVAGLPPEHPLNREELFAPFLSLLPMTDLAAGIACGNQVLYGLTAGVYARDPAEIALFLDRAAAGVLYANRRSGATTGAWPGIQSFAGWKGSGVAGKGGLGPFYLPQFMREQSRTLMEQ